MVTPDPSEQQRGVRVVPFPEQAPPHDNASGRAPAYGGGNPAEPNEWANGSDSGDAGSGVDVVAPAPADESNFDARDDPGADVGEDDLSSEPTSTFVTPTVDELQRVSIAGGQTITPSPAEASNDTALDDDAIEQSWPPLDPPGAEDSADPDPVDPVVPPDPDAGPRWRGDFTPFEVGDGGRAATVPSFPDLQNWDMRDTVLDGVLLRGESAPGVELRAASARGRNHRYRGIVRQDAYAFRCDGRFVVAAVADGVSSGPLSHVAANVVSQGGCQLIAARLREMPPTSLDWAEILEVMAKKVITSGRRRLGEHVTREDVARQLSTTALFAVLEMQPASGGHRVHLVAHGDTSAWILRANHDVWLPQFDVKNAGAEMASSSTRALPYLPEQAPVAEVAILDRGDVLMLASDGIGDPMADGKGVVAAFLADRWRDPPEPLAFAAHVDFARRSHDDDRTALALWPGRPW